MVNTKTPMVNSKALIFKIGDYEDLREPRTRTVRPVIYDFTSGNIIYEDGVEYKPTKRPITLNQSRFVVPNKDTNFSSLQAQHEAEGF